MKGRRAGDFEPIAIPCQHCASWYGTSNWYWTDINWYSFLEKLYSYSCWEICLWIIPWHSFGIHLFFFFFCFISFFPPPPFSLQKEEKKKREVERLRSAITTTYIDHLPVVVAGGFLQSSCLDTLSATLPVRLSFYNISEKSHWQVEISPGTVAYCKWRIVHILANVNDTFDSSKIKPAWNKLFDVIVVRVDLSKKVQRSSNLYAIYGLHFLGLIESWMC